MKTLNLTPTPTEYARMLVLLVRDSENLADRRWACDELVKLVSSLDAALTERTEPELEKPSDHDDARAHYEHVHQSRYDDDTHDLY